MQNTKEEQTKNERKRYHKLDGLRGLVLISMMLYHLTWDLVYMYGVKCTWYRDSIGYVWQQSICWRFILLSGFCWAFGKKKWKRGLIVLAGGAVITIVTILVMPQQRVIFGVLTLLGSCMLLMIPVEKLVTHVSPVIGLLGTMLLFLITRNVNQGSLGFEGLELFRIPTVLYRNLFTTYLGFPMAEFFSTDYFSMIPWFFLFLAGYFLQRLLAKEGMTFLQKGYCKPIEWLGRHSLILYMVHQPLIYGVLELLFL